MTEEAKTKDELVKVKMESVVAGVDFPEVEVEIPKAQAEARRKAFQESEKNLS